MSTTEVLNKGVQDLDRVESVPLHDGLVHRPVIVWRMKQPLNSQVMDSVLSAKGRPVRHPAFGPGIVWVVGSGRASSTQLQLFPECRLAKIRFVDASMEPQTREYIVDSISANNSNGTSSLTIVSRGRARYSTVMLYPSGELGEFHGSQPGRGMSPAEVIFAADSAVPPAGVDLSLRPTLTVEKAAALTGVAPTNIRELIRAGRLPAEKVGRQWMVDRQALESYKPSNRGLWRKKASLAGGDVG